MGLTPGFKLVANDADITAAIRERFSSLRLTDETGVTADTLEIALADTIADKPIKVPPTGAELELWLGFDGDLQRKGLFVVDEIELSGWPSTMTLRARAAIYEGTPKGKADMQTQKTRSWAKGTTIGAMVAKMAGEHGMQAAVSASLSGIALPHIDQTAESDISFLVRLARRYDAIAKPAGGKLVFAARGEGKSVGGADLPRITLEPGDVSSYRMTLSTRESPGTVVSFYRLNGEAERHEVTVGEGDPVRRIRWQYPDQASARAAALAELARRERGQEQLSLELGGRADLQAEGIVALDGFRDGVGGDWLAMRVEHELSSRGYTCRIEAERPNGDGAAPSVTDEVQP